MDRALILRNISFVSIMGYIFLSYSFSLPPTSTIERNQKRNGLEKKP